MVSSAFCPYKITRIAGSTFLFLYMIIVALGFISFAHSLSRPLYSRNLISSIGYKSAFISFHSEKKKNIGHEVLFETIRNSSRDSGIRLYSSEVSKNNIDKNQSQSQSHTNKNPKSYKNHKREDNLLTNMNASETNGNNRHAAVCAKLVPCNEESLRSCAERLAKDESLVSFPTETVYGLGCNALAPKAIRKVFEAKRRPLTDPLIVHVLDMSSALKLWDIVDESTKMVLMVLSKHFFPGPLTIVAKSNKDVVPDIITAGTGYVAVRSPSHPIARQLIEYSGVPIAAPSANRFGHVSPTKSIHVMEDLALEDVWVVDETSNNNETPCCNVGVESTVAKVDETNKLVSVLRQGAVSAKDIQICLNEAGLGEIYQVDVKVKSTSEQVANIAPGQTVRHYSPDVISYMISEKTQQKLKTTDQLSTKIVSDVELNILKNAVILDFGGKLSYLNGISLAYRDLSIIGNSNEGASKVFDYLRWAEQVEGAGRVYFPEIAVNNKTDALTLALKDRLTRAASGIVLDEFK